jgi:membrane protein insertase Oxa1/YidC/SpoIIIJ
MNGARYYLIINMITNKIKTRDPINKDSFNWIPAFILILLFATFIGVQVYYLLEYLLQG